ncbi:MAG: hypothetical protein IIU28_03235 [Lachnospiraceae bacterium]|nr:hypothetical protein [Lachnospiraceae bacterium]
MKNNIVTRLAAAALAAVMLLTGAPVGAQARDKATAITEQDARAAISQRQLPVGDLKSPQEDGDAVAKAIDRASARKGLYRYSSPKAAKASDWECYTSRYYYQFLTTKQRAAYDYLYSTLSRYLTDTKLEAMKINGAYYSQWYLKNCSREDIKVVFYTFLYENPQFFFVDYMNSIMTKDSLILCIYGQYASGAARESAFLQIKAKIQTYIDAAAAGTTAYEKEKIVHDKLIREVSYQQNDYDQCIASTFLMNQTVCAGFSQGFAAIMNAIGVPTICVLSTTHAWNEILLGGKWFVVDCTWDNDLQEIGYSDFYLNVSEERVRKVDDYMASYRKNPKEKTVHIPMEMYKKLNRPKAVTTFRPELDTSRFTQIYGVNVVTSEVKKPTAVQLKKKGKGKILVLAKKSGYIDGYEIRLKKGSSVKNIGVASSGDLKKTIPALKSKHTYKISIRAVRIHNGKCKFSAWTGKKAIKVA